MAIMQIKVISLTLIFDWYAGRFATLRGVHPNQKNIIAGKFKKIDKIAL